MPSTQPGTEKSAGLPPLVRLLIYLLAFVLLFILMLLIRRNIVLKKRENKFKTESSNENATNAYNYFIRQLDYLNIKQGNMMYLEFVEHAAKSVSFIDKKEMRKVIGIVLESNYSKHIVSDDKADEVINFSKGFASKLFEGASIFERLYLKYILNIC